MKILVLGAKGMLGSAFFNVLSQEREGCAGWDIDDLDLTNEEDVYSQIKRLKPDVVINCAAYTDVDGCETSIENTFLINANVPYYLARVSNDINACLVHFSTDFIFDGKSKKPYLESDKPNPINVYGRSKLAGENKIIESSNKYFIIRTEWLYGKNGKNFVDTIINLSKTKNELKIVDDQIGSPTYAPDLVTAVLNLIKTDNCGIYNITNSGQCSRFEWIKKIVELEKININLKPCKSKEFPTPAIRPSFSVLDNSKFNLLGIGNMRDWDTALKDYLIERKLKLKI